MSGADAAADAALFFRKQSRNMQLAMQVIFGGSSIISRKVEFEIRQCAMGMPLGRAARLIPLLLSDVAHSVILLLPH